MRMRSQFLQLNYRSVTELEVWSMSLSVFVTYEPYGSPLVSPRTERVLNLMVS